MGLVFSLTPEGFFMKPYAITKGNLAAQLIILIGDFRQEWDTLSPREQYDAIHRVIRWQLRHEISFERFEYMLTAPMLLLFIRLTGHTSHTKPPIFFTITPKMLRTLLKCAARPEPNLLNRFEHFLSIHYGDKSRLPRAV